MICKVHNKYSTATHLKAIKVSGQTDWILLRKLVLLENLAVLKKKASKMHVDACSTADFHHFQPLSSSGLVVV